LIEKVPDLPEHCDEELLIHQSMTSPAKHSKESMVTERRRTPSKGTTGVTKVPYLFAEVQDYSMT